MTMELFGLLITVLRLGDLRESLPGAWIKGDSGGMMKAEVIVLL